MEQVDRLGWTAGLSFSAHGVSVGIRTNDATVLQRIPSLLPPEWTPNPSPVVESLFSLHVGEASHRPGRRNFHLLYSGAALLARTVSLEEVFDALENTLHLTIAYWARPDHLFVHAGVVGWRGRAIVIPGRSFSGKTTLVSALIQAGATYYSDEMAVFDPQGRVLPYPVPLSLRTAGGKRRVTPDAWGGRAGSEPLPVGLVVVTQYQEGARWQPRPLTPARALLALLDNTVAARRDPKVSLPILRQVIEQSAALKGKRGEAAGVVAPLLALLQATTPTRWPPDRNTEEQVYIHDRLS